MKGRLVLFLGVLIVTVLAIFGWKLLKGPRLMTDRAAGLATDVYGGKPGSLRPFLSKLELKAMGISEDRAVQIYDSMMAPVFRKFKIELGDSKVVAQGAQAAQNIVWLAADGESFETTVTTEAADGGDILSYRNLVQNYWLCKYKLDGKGPFAGKSKMAAFWYGVETDGARFKAMGMKGLYAPNGNPPLSTWELMAERLEIRKQRQASAH